MPKPCQIDPRLAKNTCSAGCVGPARTSFKLNVYKYTVEKKSVVVMVHYYSGALATLTSHTSAILAQILFQIGKFK